MDDHDVSAESIENLRLRERERVISMSAIGADGVACVAVGVAACASRQDKEPADLKILERLRQLVCSPAAGCVESVRRAC